MPEQRELLLTFPELAPEAPLIPVRMVNEYVYCPRLAYRLTSFLSTLTDCCPRRRVEKSPS